MRREADFPGEPTTIGELMRTPQTTPTRDEAADFLRRLRAANVRRDAEYRAKTQGEPLPLLFRTTEFAGEVGELLNVVKKIERERLGWAGKRADRQMLLEEFGGVVATLDLLAMMLDVDLATATADEFNAVSDRLSLTTKLASAPAPASGQKENPTAVEAMGHSETTAQSQLRAAGWMRSDEDSASGEPGKSGGVDAVAWTVYDWEYRDALGTRKWAGTPETAEKLIQRGISVIPVYVPMTTAASPAATQNGPADRSTGPFRDHDPVATAATPVSEAGGERKGYISADNGQGMGLPERCVRYRCGGGISDNGNDNICQKCGASYGRD